MKITKVTVRVEELRKTEEFENKRYAVELTAEVEKCENFVNVHKKLTAVATQQVEEYFDGDLGDEDSLKKEVRAYRKQYGRL